MSERWKKWKEWYCDVLDHHFGLLIGSMLAFTISITGATIHDIIKNKKIADPTYSLRKQYRQAQVGMTSGIEKKFGIRYEGFRNKHVEDRLEEHLAYITKENPKLLQYCKKIVLHDPKDLEAEDLKKFIYFGGRAHRPDTIELCNTQLDTVVHELGHVLEYNTPDDFDAKLERIFDKDLYCKGVKGRWHHWIFLPETWEDGSKEPRNGFVRPYGAKSKDENVATYVEKAFDPTFWDGSHVQQSPHYKQMLALLNKYGFVADKQYETIMNNITAREHLEERVKKSLERLHPPTIVRADAVPHGCTYVLFDDNQMNITYGSVVHGRSAVSVNIHITQNHYQTWIFQWNNGLLEYSEKDPLGSAILQGLKKQGYEKLYDDVEWNKIVTKHAEGAY